MSKVLNMVGGGSFEVLNAHLEAYKTESGSIAANNFIQFTTPSVGSASVDYTLGNNNRLARCFYACEVSADTYVAIYNNDTDNYEYATAYRVNADGSITAGPSTLVYNVAYSSTHKAVAKIGENKGLFIHRDGLNLSTFTVNSDLSITIDSTASRSGYSSTWGRMEAIQVDTNKVVFTMVSDSSYTNYVVAVDTSNGITCGTPTGISASGNGPSLAKLSAGMLVFSNCATNGYWKLARIAVNGTTVTVPAAYTSASANCNQEIAITPVSESQALLTYTAKDYNFHVVIFDIGASTITLVSDTILSALPIRSGTFMICPPTAIRIEGNFFIVITCNYASQPVYTLIKVSDGRITELLSGENVLKSVTLNSTWSGNRSMRNFYGSRLACAYLPSTSNNYLLAFTVPVDIYIQQANSGIDGLLIEDASVSNAGNTYVL